MENEIAFVVISRPVHSAHETTLVDEASSSDSQNSKQYFRQTSSVRAQIVFLLASCVFCIDLLRLNFTIALPFMLNLTDTSSHWSRNQSEACTVQADTDGPKDDIAVERFEWTPLQQSILISAFYFGAAIFGYPAYRIASKKAPRQLLMCAMGLASLLSVFVPTAGFFGFAPALGVRFVQGAAQVCTKILSSLKGSASTKFSRLLFFRPCYEFWYLGYPLTKGQLLSYGAC